MVCLDRISKFRIVNSTCTSSDEKITREKRTLVNLLAPELFFFILAHPVYIMWIIQEPNTLELWNKLHFEEEKKTKSIYHV